MRLLSVPLVQVCDRLLKLLHDRLERLNGVRGLCYDVGAALLDLFRTRIREMMPFLAYVWTKHACQYGSAASAPYPGQSDAAPMRGGDRASSLLFLLPFHTVSEWELPWMTICYGDGERATAAMDAMRATPVRPRGADKSADDAKLFMAAGMRLWVLARAVFAQMCADCSQRARVSAYDVFDTPSGNEGPRLLGWVLHSISTVKLYQRDRYAPVLDIVASLKKRKKKDKGTRTGASGPVGATGQIATTTSESESSRPTTSATQHCPHQSATGPPTFFDLWNRRGLTEPKDCLRPFARLTMRAMLRCFSWDSVVSSSTILEARGSIHGNDLLATFADAVARARGLQQSGPVAPDVKELFHIVQDKMFNARFGDLWDKRRGRKRGRGREQAGQSAREDQARRQRASRQQARR